MLYGTQLATYERYPWTLTRGPLRIDSGEACMEFELAVDPDALRSGFSDTNEAAALGTESPSLLVDGEVRRTSNLYCFADGQKMTYRAIFRAFPPVVEVYLRWHHRASGINVDELLRRED